MEGVLNYWITEIVILCGVLSFILILNVCNPEKMNVVQNYW
jgi:hypothetical protein